MYLVGDVGPNMDSSDVDYICIDGNDTPFASWPLSFTSVAMDSGSRSRNVFEVDYLA